MQRASDRVARPSFVFHSLRFYSLGRVSARPVAVAQLGDRGVCVGQQALLRHLINCVSARSRRAHIGPRSTAVEGALGAIISPRDRRIHPHSSGSSRQRSPVPGIVDNSAVRITELTRKLGTAGLALFRAGRPTTAPQVTR